MKNILLLLSILFISSCISRKNVVIKKHLKEYAFCKCLDISVLNFSGKDSSDISTYASLLEVEKYGITFDYRNKIYQTLDSAAMLIVKEEKRRRIDSVNRHEDVVGKTTYKLSCLKFYESRYLDSLIKSLKIEIRKQENSINF